jgi:hypothetical protein
VQTGPTSRTTIKEPAQGDAPAEETLPTVTLIEEGSEKGVPDSLPVVEVQMALLPQQADASAVGRTGEEMAREEPLLTSDAAALDEEPAQEETLPREAVAIVQEEALAADGKATTAAMAGMVPPEVPTTLALVGAADADRGGRSSLSLAQTVGDLPARGGARREADSQDPIAAILAFGDEMEDIEWRNISDALSASLGALHDITAPACQV